MNSPAVGNKGLWNYPGGKETLAPHAESGTWASVGTQAAELESCHMHSAAHVLLVIPAAGGRNGTGAPNSALKGSLVFLLKKIFY